MNHFPVLLRLENLHAPARPVRACFVRSCYRCKVSHHHSLSLFLCDVKSHTKVSHHPSLSVFLCDVKSHTTLHWVYCLQGKVIHNSEDCFPTIYIYIILYIYIYIYIYYNLIYIIYIFNIIYIYIILYIYYIIYIQNILYFISYIYILYILCYI